MKYIEYPNENFSNDSTKKIFIAGGIRDCTDWQTTLINKLSSLDIVVVSPRKREWTQYDMLNNPERQISWVVNSIKKCDAVSFWLPDESICSMALFELGYVLNSKKETFVGMSPYYKKRIDIEQVLKIFRPEIDIVYNIDDLSNQIIESYS